MFSEFLVALDFCRSGGGGREKAGGQRSDLGESCSCEQ